MKIRSDTIDTNTYTRITDKISLLKFIKTYIMQHSNIIAIL